MAAKALGISRRQADRLERDYPETFEAMRTGFKSEFSVGVWELIGMLMHAIKRDLTEAPQKSSMAQKVLALGVLTDKELLVSGDATSRSERVGGRAGAREMSDEELEKSVESLSEEIQKLKQDVAEKEVIVVEIPEAGCEENQV